MEPTIIICGRYINSESSTLYDKYIKTTNLCELHKLGFSMINNRKRSNRMIISFIEKIAEMKKINPNFLTSYKQLISRKKPILTNWIGTVLLKLTVSWLESLIDYENVNPELFETDLFMICNDAYECDFDMTDLIKKINSLIINCECRHIMTLSQKMYTNIPIYSKLNLVCDIISKIDFTDHTINIDDVVTDAFITIKKEFRKPRTVLIKEVSELPRNLRTKINEAWLETKEIEGRFSILNESKIVTISNREPRIHKSDKGATVTKINHNDSVCVICDSIIHQSKYTLEKNSNLIIAIKNCGRHQIMCNIFCNILLDYVVKKLICSELKFDSRKEILMVKNIRTKLFLLYNIKIQANFCSDLMKYIGLFFLATMKRSKS